MLFLFKLTKNTAILATSRVKIIIRWTSRFSVRKVLVDCMYEFQHHRPALNTPHITWSIVIFIGTRSSRDRSNTFELMIVNKKKNYAGVLLLLLFLNGKWLIRLVVANHWEGIVSPPLRYKPRVFREQLHDVKRYECPED